MSHTLMNLFRRKRFRYQLKAEYKLWMQDQRARPAMYWLNLAS